MGKIYQKPGVGPAWAENANNPADLITMNPADVATGWPLTGTPPSRQRFNYLLNWATAGVRYFMQRGCVDWDVNETYAANALVIDPTTGNIFKSNPLIASNQGNPPSTSPNNWTQVGWSAAQINALGLTQANINTGDSSTKVSNTNFVAAACAAVAQNAQAALDAANANLVIFINNAIAGVNNTITANYNSLVGQIAAAKAQAIAAIAPGFSFNIASEGWVVFPSWASGFAIVWGSGPDPNGGTITHNFASPFTHACLQCVITSKFGGNSRILEMVSFNNGSVTVHNNGTSAGFTYIAVGY